MNTTVIIASIQQTHLISIIAAAVTHSNVFVCHITAQAELNPDPGMINKAPINSFNEGGGCMTMMYI